MICTLAQFDRTATNATVDLISGAIGYADHRSRSHDAVIRVYDDVGNVIETHEHKGDFKEWLVCHPPSVY